eukprot:2061633-Rhodomonas_salina.1
MGRRREEQEDGTGKQETGRAEVARQSGVRTGGKRRYAPSSTRRTRGGSAPVLPSGGNVTNNTVAWQRQNPRQRRANSGQRMRGRWDGA